MKKSVLMIFMFALLFSIAGIYAVGCNAQVSLINQDPYPATQGDYVKLVFQIDGVSNPECGTIEFELVEKYPISFDPGVDSKRIIESGFYKTDYGSFFLATYKVRVDANALSGDNPIETKIKYGNMQGYETEQFELNIEDARTDFEIFVNDYDSSTNILTLEILNIGEVDIEALTLEIPKQENVTIKGANVNIAGDLDSNEYTTVDFNAIPSEGEIQIKITYTDGANERRTLEKSILFEPEYFSNNGEKSGSSLKYFIWIVVILGIAYYFYRRYKKKKAMKKRHQLHPNKKGSKAF